MPSKLQQDYLLYLDVLGFGILSQDPLEKVEEIIQTLIKSKVSAERTYKVVMFSDTVLVTNDSGSLDPRSSIQFLVEYFTQIQYRLANIGIFVRGVITHGCFAFYEQSGVNVFYGPAIIAAYEGEKKLKAVGLFLPGQCKEACSYYPLVEFQRPYYFIVTLPGVVAHKDHSYRVTVPSTILEETDELGLLHADINLLRQIHETKTSHDDERVREKHQATWDLIHSHNPDLLDALEEADFDPSVINDEYDWSQQTTYLEE